MNAQRVGIGSIQFTPTNTLDVRGATAIGTNYAGIATAAPTNGLLVESNVGIGTTNPSSSMLTVQNGITLDNANSHGSSLGSNCLRFGNGSGEAIACSRSSATNQYGLDFYTSSTNRMSITNGGFVGIGTSTPLAGLEINTNTTAAATNGIALLIKPSNLGLVGGFINTATSPADIVFQNSDGTERARINTDDASTDSNGMLIFGTGNGTTAQNSAMKIGRSTELNGDGIGRNVQIKYGLSVGAVSSDFFLPGYDAPGAGVVLDVNGVAKFRNGIGVTGVGFFSGIVYCNGVALCSDARYKKDIKPISNALASIKKVNGVNYFMKNEEFKEKGFDNKLQYGVIAQDLEKIFPEMVLTDDKGYKSVDYTRLIPVLIEALKEQQQLIETQGNKIEGLNQKVEVLLNNNKEAKTNK